MEVCIAQVYQVVITTAEQYGSGGLYSGVYSCHPSWPGPCHPANKHSLSNCLHSKYQNMYLINCLHGA